jgi:peptidoglycan/LPS O-acetylase OafA/YrhL
MDLMNTAAGPGFYRLFLAILVIIHHVSSFNMGSAAVYIFFSLSGFWINAMWRDRYSRAQQPYWTFIVSRFWRLAPVFVVCSAVAWIVAFRLAVPPNLNWFTETFSSLFILGYSGLTFMPNGPAWSLDYEMQFYLIAPALSAAMLIDWRAALIVSILISGISFLIALPGTAASCLFPFALGAASSSVKWRPSSKIAALSLFATCMLLVGILFSPYRDLVLGGAHPGPLYRYNEHLNLVVAVLMLPCTIYTTTHRGGRYDPVWGDMSFIVYLIHWPIMLAVDVSSGTHIHRAFHIGVAFCLIGLTSWLIWKFIDRPLNRLRHGWVDGRIRSRNSHIVSA